MFHHTTMRMLQPVTEGMDDSPIAGGEQSLQLLPRHG
jgi:hypothetical protein